MGMCINAHTYDVTFCMASGHVTRMHELCRILLQAFLREWKLCCSVSHAKAGGFPPGNLTMLDWQQQLDGEVGMQRALEVPKLLNLHAADLRLQGRIRHTPVLIRILAVL